jgi:hypothetical protein
MGGVTAMTEHRRMDDLNPKLYTGGSALSLEDVS